MLRIYKFPIEITDIQTLSIKGYNRCLSVIEQNDKLVIYAYVDIDNENEKQVEIAVIGTGNSITGEIMFNWTFLGTVQTKIGFVWHVYYTNHGR